MSKNSQKLNYTAQIEWLKGVNPKSESLHQPKVVVENKPFYKKPLKFR